MMNKASVNGLRPCYLSVDRANRYLLTAGYHDGKLTVLRLNEDGTIQGVTDEVFMKRSWQYCRKELSLSCELCDFLTG